MSHQKIRSEKTCLNCGHEVALRFCPVCGQENIEPKQSVWHLISHFFSDVTHFDGKFFTTVKDLFIKPGFLSREFISGKRIRYLDPVRMYIFTSAIFFIIFFSLFDIHKGRMDENSKKELLKDPTFRKMVASAKTAEDTLKLMQDYRPTGTDIVKVTRDSIQPEGGIHLHPFIGDFNSVGQYDTVQMHLAPEKRDSWLKSKYKRRVAELNENFQNNPTTTIQELFSRFLHNFPKALFISLPVFAFLLQVLYWRKKQFMYVDHGIFSIHLYIFSFLMLLVMFGISQINAHLDWRLLFWLNAAILIYTLIYYYRAMKIFYGQGRSITLLKFFSLLIMSAVVQFIIFMLVFLFTAFES